MSDLLKDRIDILVDKAKSGDATAQLSLAKCFHAGRLVEKSSDLAKYWAFKAIQNGNGKARGYYQALVAGNTSSSSKFVDLCDKISVFPIFEYTIAFMIIGYPNPLLIGLLSGILNMIPYLGGMLTVLITILLAPKMIIKISILYIILGLVDGYIISPYVYGKYNEVNPILGLFAISIGSIFGPIGIISSFPVLIVLLSTIKYFKCKQVYPKG